VALAFAMGAVVLGWLVGRQDVDGIRGAIIVSVVSIASLLIFHLASRDDPLGPLLFRLLVASFVLKLCAVAFRLWLIYEQYGGSADALGYYSWGARVSELIRTSGLPELDHYYSTSLVRLLAAIFYVFTGPTVFGAFAFWAWLGLLGMLFFYKAFTVAFPQGDRRLFAVLILLYPSMLLWTSSLGKDALVSFALGLMTYGVAVAMRRIDIGGALAAGAGLVGVLFIRPHIAAIACVATVVGWLWRPVRAGAMTPVVKMGAMLVMALLAVLIVRTSASFVQLEDFSAEGVLGFIDERQERTERGGAVIERGLPTNPVAFADAMATVFFRPYPWEAHNVLARIAAAEGVLLVGLFLWRWQSVRAAFGNARRDGTLMMALVYVLLFAFFFSAISNFAIIARQRHQVLPFIFIWLAYLPWRAEARPQ
jgi:hypothetical protein